MALNVSNKSYSNSPNTPLSRAVILHEDPNESPNEDEINLYASSIGIDLAKEPALAWIAKEGISAPLPKGWQVLQDENNQIFYYNASSGQSLWDHPLDSYYRSRVLQARKSMDLKSRASQPTVRTPSRSSGRSSCSTLTHESNYLARLSSRHLSTANAISSEKTKLDDEVELHFTRRSQQTPYWADTPLLGEESRGGSSSVESKGIVGTVVSVSETELPTEYCELVPSPSVVATGTKLQPSVRSQALLSQKATTAAQTDACDLDETTKCSSELIGVDTQPEKTIPEVVADVRTNGNNLSASTGSIQQDLHSSSVHQQRRILFPINTDKQTDIQSHPAIVGKKVDKNRADQSILDSPTAKVDHSKVLGSCPELGSSPTENDSNRLPTQTTDTIDKEDKYIARKPNPKIYATTVSEQLSSQSAHIPFLSLNRAVSPCPAFHQPITPVNSAGVEFTPHTEVHSSSQLVGTLAFNEGMNHLVEERARLQRKLLRIKLIYKDYKQRLNSLDSSLQLLQKTSNPDSCPTPYDSKRRNTIQPDAVSIAQNVSQKPIRNFSTVTTSPLFCDLSPTEPSSPRSIQQDLHHPSPEVITPEIVNIREGIQQSSGVRAFKSGRSLSIPRHTVSLFGSTLASKPIGNRSSTTCGSHGHPSPFDVAHSLASIDTQLHRVMHHLESSDVSTACNECVLKNHSFRQSAKQSITCMDSRLPLSSHRVSNENVLEEEMKNLSIRRQKENSGLTVGGLRLLTPVSLEDQMLGFQRPHVDASPTCLHSD